MRAPASPRPCPCWPPLARAFPGPDALCSGPLAASRAAEEGGASTLTPLGLWPSARWASSPQVRALPLRPLQLLRLLRPGLRDLKGSCSARHAHGSSGWGIPGPGRGLEAQQGQPWCWGAGRSRRSRGAWGRGCRLPNQASSQPKRRGGSRGPGEGWTLVATGAGASKAAGKKVQEQAAVLSW